VAQSICAVSGAAGQEVLCDLKLARGVPNLPVPAGLQLTLTWDNTASSLVHFQDDVCVGGMCNATPAPPAALFPSGHTLNLDPSDPANWQGGGQLIIINFASPSAPVSEAYLQGDDMIGDPQFAQARFVLKKDISALDPAYVFASGITASNANATAELVGEVSEGVMVLTGVE